MSEDRNGTRLTARRDGMEVKGYGERKDVRVDARSLSTPERTSPDGGILSSKDTGRRDCSMGKWGAWLDKYSNPFNRPASHPESSTRCCKDRAMRMALT